jgi:hypothetical protein
LKSHNIKNFFKWITTHKDIKSATTENTLLMRQVVLLSIRKEHYPDTKKEFERIQKLLYFFSDYSNYQGEWGNFMSFWIASIIEKLIYYAEKESREEQNIAKYLKRCLLLKTSIDMSHCLIDNKTVLYRLAQHGYFEAFKELQNTFPSKEAFKEQLFKPQINNFQKTDGSVWCVIQDRKKSLEEEQTDDKELRYWNDIITHFSPQNQENLSLTLSNN